MINIKDLADILGVSRATIYNWTHLGRIPHFKVGKHLRFDLDEVMAHFRGTPSDSYECASKWNGFGSLTIEKMTIADPSPKEE